MAAYGATLQFGRKCGLQGEDGGCEKGWAFRAYGATAALFRLCSTEPPTRLGQDGDDWLTHGRADGPAYRASLSRWR